MSGATLAPGLQLPTPNTHCIASSLGVSPEAFAPAPWPLPQPPQLLFRGNMVGEGADAPPSPQVLCGRRSAHVLLALYRGRGRKKGSTPAPWLRGERGRELAGPGEGREWSAAAGVGVKCTLAGRALWVHSDKAGSRPQRSLTAEPGTSRAVRQLEEDAKGAEGNNPCTERSARAREQSLTHVQAILGEGADPAEGRCQ